MEALRIDLMTMPRRYGGLCLHLAESLTSGLPCHHVHCLPKRRAAASGMARAWGIQGRFTARAPIPYFKANIAVLARKLDEWVTMPDEQLDQQKARALELSCSGIRRCRGRSTRLLFKAT